MTHPNTLGYRLPTYPPPPGPRYARARKWTVNPSLSEQKRPDDNLMITFDKDGNPVAVEIIK